MRKINFLILFLGVFIYAQAYDGPYYQGINDQQNGMDRGTGMLQRFLRNIEEFDVFEYFPELQDGEHLQWGNGEYVKERWSKIPGFIWRADMTWGQPSDDANSRRTGGHPDLTHRGWEAPTDEFQYNYWQLRAINWKNFGWHHHPDSGLIRFGQYPFLNNVPIGGTEGDGIPALIAATTARVTAQSTDIRYCKYFDFSGNFFHSVAVLGYDALPLFETFDISNNPTLKSLNITGLSNLKYLGIAGCNHPDLQVAIGNNRFTFSKLYNLLANSGLLPVPAFLTYGPNTYPNVYAAPTGLVDFSADVSFEGKTTTFEFTDLEGAILSPTLVRPGVYQFNNFQAGDTVFCTAKNAWFDQLPEGITTKIGLGEYYPLEFTSLSNLIDTDQSLLKNMTTRPMGTEMEAGWMDLWGAFPNGAKDKTKDWWKVPGLCWTHSGEMVRPVLDDLAQLPYTNSDKYYPVLRSIDWSGQGFKQKDGSQIVMQILNESAAYELSHLKSVNFSGNLLQYMVFDFYGFKNDLKSIDVSNNPDLKYFRCTRCNSLESLKADGLNEDNPDLKVIFSHSWLTFSRIFSILESGNFIKSDNSIKSYVDYGEQNGFGAIYKMFEVDNVDLSAENSFKGFTSTFEFTDEDGAALSPAVVSPGVFRFDNSFLGQEVTCVIKNDFFKAMPKGITLKIKLTDAAGMVNTEKITANENRVFFDGEKLVVTGENAVTEVFALTGQRLLTSAASFINVSSLNKGIYIAKTTADGVVTTTKFVKF